MLFDIVEYLGKIDNGVLVIITLNYNEDYYDATFYYKENFITLTIDEKLEEEIGIIEDWEGYNQLVLDLMKKVVPYEEILGRLDEIEIEE